MEDTPESLQQKCIQLAAAIQQAQNVVLYTGAGISTVSMLRSTIEYFVILCHSDCVRHVIVLFPAMVASKEYRNASSPSIRHHAFFRDVCSNFYSYLALWSVNMGGWSTIWLCRFHLYLVPDHARLTVNSQQQNWNVSQVHTTEIFWIYVFLLPKVMFCIVVQSIDWYVRFCVFRNLFSFRTLFDKKSMDLQCVF